MLYIWKEHNITCQLYWKKIKKIKKEYLEQSFL